MSDEKKPILHEYADEVEPSNGIHQESSSSDEEFTTEPMRWLALTQFMILTALNGFQWICFSNVIRETEQHFNMTYFEANFLSTLYYALYVIGAPVGCHAFQMFGLKGTLRIGSALNLLGAVLRLISALFLPNFTMMCIAQIINATAQLFTLAGPPILAVMWFPDRHRTGATTAAAVANSAGNALGMLIPPLIITPTNNGRAAWTTLFAIVAGLCVVEAFLGNICVPPRPASPPSPTAKFRRQQDEKERRERQSRGLSWRAELAAGTRALCRAFVTSFSTIPKACLFFSICLCMGSMWSLSSLLAQMLHPYGVADQTVGWMGFTNVCCGLLAALVVGTYTGLHRIYRVPLLIILFLNLLAQAGMGIVLSAHAHGGSLSSRETGLIFFLYVVTGIMQSSVLPLGFEYAAEATFPTEEAVSGVIIVWLANGLGMLQMLAIPPIALTQSASLSPSTQRNQAAGAMWSFGVYAVISLLVFWLAKVPLLRMKFEQQRPLDQDGVSSIEEHVIS